ncbi:CopZ family metallochaperone [Thiocystis violascens]|uniref:Copper chaperone n=1 Tax=Thiocystis violascens (strain ATCC 17096 / DSM 198 / 6111) TaxID=765911 RepID=I3YHA6_THIV6|nr:heavy-metal-associated domain-containing protein [Thiocystis violascens]AFL76374.1 copper chaperone [Thiocystis violascens DSM 198]
MTIELKISGMSCQHCVKAVTEAIQAVPGVESVEVDLARGVARVAGPADADANALIAAVIAAGYGAEPA